MYSIPETLWALALVKSKGLFCVRGLPGHRLLTIAIVGTPTKQGQRPDIPELGPAVRQHCPESSRPRSARKTSHGTRDVLRTSVKCLGTFCSKQAKYCTHPLPWLNSQGITLRLTWKDRLPQVVLFFFSFCKRGNVLLSESHAALNITRDPFLCRGSPGS